MESHRQANLIGKVKEVLMAPSETELGSTCLQGSTNVLINGYWWGRLLTTYMAYLSLIGPNLFLFIFQ